MTTYQRVKRWREKHRDEYNSKRRKENLSGGVESRHAEPIPTGLHTSGSGAGREGAGKNREQCSTANVAIPTVSGSSAPPAQPFPCMISSSFIAESVDEEPPPQVYRDSYGRQITKANWEKLQEMNRKAEAGGYEAGDYSQL